MDKKIDVLEDLNKPMFVVEERLFAQESVFDKVCC